MGDINRRQFVGAAGAAAFLTHPATAADRPHGFLRESGKRGAWPLVVGLLSTTNPSRHELAISLLRRRHSFPRPLLYTSTDRSKAGFASALIDYYAGARDLVFTALVVADPAGRWAETAEKDAAYAGVYRQLLMTAAAPEMVIAMPHRNENRRDRALRQFLKDDPGVVTVAAKSGNLNELAGFLAGCIYGEATGARHGVKRRLTDRLLAGAGPTKLAVRTISI